LNTVLKTQINYELADNEQKASLHIYILKGKQLKRIFIHQWVTTLLEFMVVNLVLVCIYTPL